jgi:hypothetical protein
MTSGPVSAFWRPKKYFHQQIQMSPQANARPILRPRFRKADAHGCLDRDAHNVVRFLLVKPAAIWGMSAKACYEVSDVLLHIR